MPEQVTVVRVMPEPVTVVRVMPEQVTVVTRVLREAVRVAAEAPRAWDRTAEPAVGRRPAARETEALVARGKAAPGTAGLAARGTAVSAGAAAREKAVSAGTPVAARAVGAEEHRAVARSRAPAAPRGTRIVAKPRWFRAARSIA
jgi:hypothetical protein